MEYSEECLPASPAQGERPSSMSGSGAFPTWRPQPDIGSTELCGVLVLDLVRRLALDACRP
jgi:hypothetical protein